MNPRQLIDMKAPRRLAGHFHTPGLERIVTTLLARVLNEPVVDKLLQESLGILAPTPALAKGFYAAVHVFVERIIQIASELPFCEQGPADCYWKDAWLQWLDGIEKEPRIVQLTKMYEKFFQNPRISTDDLRGCLRLLVRTVAIVTGLLEAEVSIDLFYA